jgi:hypothetical protein
MKQARNTGVARKPLVVPSAWELDWTAIPTTDGNVPGPTLKVMRTDARTGGMTFLTHLPPNWTDPELDWHPSTEEGYIIAGDVVLNDRHLNAGCYLFRPPGILHGPVYSPNDLGATILQRTSGPLRILRYTGKKFPHRDLQPITNDHLKSDVAWSERTDTNSIRWVGVKKGPWAGTRVRWIHRNVRTGGGMVMLDIPAGWSGKGSAAKGDIEEFVLAGTLRCGGETLRKWGYAFRPSGAAAGRYSSRDGARLIAWWDHANELQ